MITKLLAGLIALSLIFTAVASDIQNVGSDFGRSWLKQNGTNFVKEETRPSLWNWGNIPKGYTDINGKLYPPGYEPKWYYPDFMISSVPILINKSANNKNFYIPTNFASPPFFYEDPWILAQLTGRPVATFSAPLGPLF